MGKLKEHQPSTAMDSNHRLIYERYKQRERQFNSRGLFLAGRRWPYSLKI